MTFLRVAEAHAVPDCAILLGKCVYTLNQQTGKDDDPLLRARYGYVRRAIIRKLDTIYMFSACPGLTHSSYWPIFYILDNIRQGNPPDDGCALHK